MEDSAMILQNEYFDFSSPAYNFELNNHMKIQGVIPEVTFDSVSSISCGGSK